MQTLKDKIKLGGLRVQPPYTDRNVYPLGYLRPDGAIQIIGEINADGGTELETRSSADQIVHAVNCHADLLAACCEALVVISQHYPESATCCHARIDKIKSAITKARPGLSL